MRNFFPLSPSGSKLKNNPLIKPREWISDSIELTHQIGFELGRCASSGAIFSFFGELGAGKTTLIKGFVAGAIGLQPERVSSPTFTYLNIYQKEPLGPAVHHFDLYRLQDGEEFLSRGFEDFLFCPAIVCIEWSERIEGLLKGRAVIVRVDHLDARRRKITVGDL